MIIAHTIEEVRAQIYEWKKAGFTIGFVPTMGYLHEGHQSLILKSAEQNTKTVVSIYVNPTQFAPTEDFSSYPRDFEADSELCRKSGVDLIFCPNDNEMYGKGSCVYVSAESLTNELCGKSRPTHFRGVCTVVCKLFNIITPDRAYFGQKDAQQLAVIRKMTMDLNINVEVIGCPIMREPDGLAKSSRNIYLSAEERKAALVLSKAVSEGEKLLKSGVKEASKIIDEMKRIINTEPLAKIDYVEIVDADIIERLDYIDNNINVLIAVAVYIGKTRLIDNFIMIRS